MKKKSDIHILIVDDEKLNIELAAAYLQEEGYKLSFATNATAAIESVLSKNINLILLDINMPKTDGFEVCKMLKADTKTKDIPVIFLTAQTSIEYISRAFEVGGVDYINKPFNGVELKARVKTHLQSMAYLQEIKEKQSKLAQLSITDTLTKLNNSLYFDAQLRTKILQDKKYWVLYIKIDNFEKINRIYGFEQANKILKLFAQSLNEVSFSNATLAKLYGVSFGIILKDYDKKSIKDLVTSIKKNFQVHKELNKYIFFSTVALKSKSKTTVPTIYKKLQSGLESIVDDRSGEVLFIE